MPDSANDEPFTIKTAPQPMLQAVDELASSLGRNIEEMELYTMGQVFEMAVDHYGEPLPDYWRVWKDWHDPDEIQPMGDL